MDKQQRETQSVAVLFGGRSVEHEISILSGLQVIEALDILRYRPLPVYVTHDGRWYSGDALLDRGFYRRLPSSLTSIDEVVLLPVPGVGGLLKVGGRRRSLPRFPIRHDAAMLPVDIYLPVFHGTFGEDGCIQGLLELAGATYTGSGVLASALGMNKLVCKSLAEHHGVPVLPAVLVSRDEVTRSLPDTRQRILQTRGLGSFPFVVKPCSLGSSVGLGMASDAAELNAALVRATSVDSQVLVEPLIAPMIEINVSVLGPPPSTSVVEVPVADGALLTYEAKYLREEPNKSSQGEGMAAATRVIDPPDLSTALKQQVLGYARTVFGVLGCEGLARLDFILDTKTECLYFNEINTLPGSLAHYLWAASTPPLLLTEVLHRLIETAIHRRARELSLQREMPFRAPTLARA